LASNRLTDYQPEEKLAAMPALGARQSSQLVAARLEMCLVGGEKDKIFPALLQELIPA
jgi:hypothetical protein